MTTPETKSFRKNYAVAGISKNLLTPCRRIGLSRTKKTPKNICAIPQSDIKHQHQKISDATSRKQRYVKESGNNQCQVKLNSEKGKDEIDMVLSREETSEKGKTSSQHDLSGRECIKSVLMDDDVEDQSENKSNEMTKIKAGGIDAEIKTSIIDEDSDFQCRRTKDRKRKLVFDTERENSSSKKTPSTKSKQIDMKKEDSSKDTENEPGVVLGRFTTEDYLKEFSANPEAFYENGKDLDDFATLCNKKNKIEHEVKKQKLSSKSSEQLKKLSDALKTEKKLKQLSVDVERLPSEKSESKYDSEDEDDMFVASPQTDQQKEDLLKLIIAKEKEIQEKETKLQQLKLARVYKKKHSPRKLAVHSVQWLKGCKLALKDLLEKMQEHKSIDMECLVKNLRIPSEIVDKLSL